MATECWLPSSCAAEAHAPPPSRLLTEEVEEDTEEGHVFIRSFRALMIEILAGSRAADDADCVFCRLTIL